MNYSHLMLLTNDVKPLFSREAGHLESESHLQDIVWRKHQRQPRRFELRTCFMNVVEFMVIILSLLYDLH